MCTAAFIGSVVIIELALSMISFIAGYSFGYHEGVNDGYLEFVEEQARENDELDDAAHIVNMQKAGK